jgi:hypothetical protein
MRVIDRRKPKRSWLQTAAVSRYKVNQPKAICVALEPHAIVLKWKGTRRYFRLPYESALLSAVLKERQAAERKKAEEKGGKVKSRRSVHRGLLRLRR